MKKTVAILVLFSLFSILFKVGQVSAVEPIEVTIETPSQVVTNSYFTIKINIGQVTDFDAAVYTINYDSKVFLAENVTPGSGAIGVTIIPVDAWAISPDKNSISIAQNIPGLVGVSGAGYLASIRFQVIGAFGTSSGLTFTNGSLSDILSNNITANWKPFIVSVTAVRGDANGDGLLNAQDITKLERIIAGLDLPYTGADANLDGSLNALDITKLERMLVGLP